MRNETEEGFILKKGIVVIIFFGLLFLISFLFGLHYEIFRYFSLVLFILLLVVIYFFRDPVRMIVADTNVIYSPADGKIIEITDSGNEFCIKIFMNVFNVHVQRSPVAGFVKEVFYKKGKFYPAGNKNTDYLNEQNLIVIKSNNGLEIKVLQIAGLVARRIVSLVKIGEEIKQGQKIGYILLGSQVNLTLPKDKVLVLVEKKQTVFAGITKIALLK